MVSYQTLVAGAVLLAVVSSVGVQGAVGDTRGVASIGEEEPAVVGTATGANPEPATQTLETESDNTSFEVGLTDVPSSIAAGDELRLRVTANNTGAAEQTQRVSVRARSDRGTVFTAERAVTLAPDESAVVEFRYQTDIDDTPELTVTAASADQRDSETVDILTWLPALDVAPQTVVFPTTGDGETSTERIVLENTGSATIELPTVQVGGADPSGFETRTEQVRLDPGDQRSVPVTFAPPNPGEYEAQVELRDESGVVRGSASVSGTAVGSSEQDDDGETAVDVQRVSGPPGQTTVTAEIDGAAAGERVDIPLPVRAGEQEFGALSAWLVTSVDTDATVNITTSSDSLDTTPDAPFPDDGTTQLGNISITSSLGSDDVTEVAFSVLVDPDQIAQFQSTPEDLALYGFDEAQSAWVEEETELRGQDGDRIRLLAVSERFSEWTVGVKRPSFAVTETDVGVETAATGEPVSVQVSVRNTGGTDGTYTARLSTDQGVVETRETTVPAGETAVVSIEQPFSEPGSYQLRVNDVQLGEINITDDEDTTPEPGENTPETTPEPGEDTPDQTDTPATEGDSDDAGGPGFSVVSALAGLALTGYLLGRRRLEAE